MTKLLIGRQVFKWQANLGGMANNRVEITIQKYTLSNRCTNAIGIDFIIPSGRERGPGY